MADSSLLEQSRSLAYLIQDATDLPPVARSIHQIAEQSERMLATTSAAPQAPAAATYKFLASQGVDAMDLDPNALDMTRAANTTGLDAAALGTADDLEAFLATEQRQILHEAVLEANQLVVDEFDGAFWTQGREQWEAIKPRILHAYRFEAGRYDPAAPVAPGAAAAAPAAGAALAGAASTARRVAVPRVEAPWEAVAQAVMPAPPGGNGRDSGQGEEAADPWGGLEIPEARNHRFFVRHMAEFREQLLPSEEEEGEEEEGEEEEGEEEAEEEEAEEEDEGDLKRQD